MVVILGYRRQRNFERVLFFLCLAFFLFYGGSLLALNSQIYYPKPPAGLQAFRDCRYFRRALLVSCAAAASSHGVCANALLAPGQGMGARHPGAFFSCWF